MKLLKQLFGALLVTAAALALFVACSSEGDDCGLDSDCSSDQVCEASVCVSTCTGDADCAAGESCEARTGGSELVCKTSSTENNVNNTNNANNSNNLNNTNNSNTMYGFFLIRDTTVGDGCAEADPGSDLQYVSYADGTGTTLGHSLLRDAAFGPEDPNDFIDTGILDGNPPDFAGDCTDSFTDLSVVAMGCGGEFLFQPVDGTGTPVQLEASVNSITVGEYGSGCGGSSDDSFEVIGCTTSDGSIAGSTCDVSFGSGEGILIVDVN